MKTKDYCRAVKAALGISSDYALAKALATTRQSVSHYVNGRRAFDPTTAAKVAELLRVSPLKVIADAELERGADTQLWQRLRAAAALVVCAIGAATLGLPTPSQAAQGAFNIIVFPASTGGSAPTQHNAGRNTHCRQSRRRWRLLIAALLGLLSTWCAHADGLYLGARASSSTQTTAISSSSRVGPTYEVDDQAQALGAFAGFRRGFLALELGAGELGHRAAHNVGPGFDIRQDIDTRLAYAALVPELRRGAWSAFALAGVARVSFSNFERGANENGPAVEQRNSGAATVPLFGAGVAYTVGRSSLRLELLEVRDVARSIWTNTSDVRAVSIGLQVAL